MERTEGYAPIRGYAAIGDGRTVALVAADGAVDWLTLPTVASDPVFAAILDPQRGGSFALCPDEAFESTRRYLPRTNVLETTFTTADGVVRVTDAITNHVDGLLPWFELARRVECLGGSVRMRLRVDPRLSFSGEEVVLEHADPPTWTCGLTSLALLAFDAGDGPDTTFELRDGERALLALVGVEHEPVPHPLRDEIEKRLDMTGEICEQWIASHDYDGPWQEEVERSALALKLLTYMPAGAMVAAPTTSLPERLGGGRNWDYRFAWVRDSSYVLDALLALGRREFAHSSFSWLLQAIGTTAPDIRPLYALDGGVRPDERELDLAGYRGSRPVRMGNAAQRQVQLGVYGDVLDTAYRYVREGNALDPRTRELLVGILRRLAERWRDEDSGFWELRDRTRHYTHSKLSAQVAFDRALRLAQLGELPNDDAQLWARERDEVRAFVDSRCWSPTLNAYRFVADEDALDATTLLAYRCDPERTSERLSATIDAVREQLGAGGPLLYRYTGVIGCEGAFLACSFWLADALAHEDRLDEAAEVMEDTLALANDVGLYAEEIDPGSHEFLGNFPQGLSHLALIQAAVAINSRRSSVRARASGTRRRR